MYKTYIFIIYKIRIGEKGMSITRFSRSAPFQSYIHIFDDAIATCVMI